MSMVPSSYFHRPFHQQVLDPFQESDYWGTIIAPPPPPPPPPPPRPAFSTESVVKLEWKETPEAHVFRTHLPAAVNRNQVKVEVEEGRILSISWENCMEKEVKGEMWHRVERSTGSFQRRFRLPENAKVHDLTAYMENGVLTVKVPKEETMKHHPKRSIQIM